MNIVIDTTDIERFFSLPADEMFWVFMGTFGWIIIGFIFLSGVLQLYLYWIRGKWAAKHKHILLAIDIPKGNEQTPKAVENMFTYLAGAHGSENFFETWFEGKFQKSFSYEIVSLEGYTQFLIWTPIEFRNLIESSVYSQYPDAEISEVDDYTQNVPQRYPDEEYDIWGTEFMQAQHWVYPIKLYEEFEHKMGPSETQFKDPMATLMDLCGSLRQGEQLWLQYIVVPIGFDWVKQSEKEIDKILGKKPKPSTDFFSMILGWLGELSEIFYSIWSDVEASEPKEERPKSIIELPPKDQKKIEAISSKANKLAFDVKVRAVYIAQKDVMNKAKVANGLVGFMKQFISLDLNNLKPDVKKTMTKTVYFYREPRLRRKKNTIFNAYKDRSDSVGRTAGVMNIEELATLWHFPVEASVRASLIQKATGRKADAPSSLPMESDLTFAPDDLFSSPYKNGNNYDKRDEDENNKPDNSGKDEEDESNEGDSNEPDVKKKNEADFLFGNLENDNPDKTSAPPSNLPFV